MPHFQAAVSKLGWMAMCGEMFFWVMLALKYKKAFNSIHVRFFRTNTVALRGLKGML